MAKKQTNRTKKTASEKPKAGIEIGSTGTNIFAGIVREEYLPELSGVRAIKTYDEMRKSDATVKAALSAIQLPIRRAQWFVTPGTDDDAGKEIAEFVSRALFDEMSITWDDFLRQALLNTTYGVMVFEKVFAMRDIDGAQRIVWQKFAPRLPRSITAWEQTDGSAGITQTTNDAGSVSIPMEKLLIFTNDKEGDNWWGISVLRSAYKHWYIKKNLETIDAVGHERQGLGIPFVKLPTGATEADKRQAETILSNMRAHEEGYLVEPDNITVDFKDMKASGVKDAARAIDYHDREISKAVLAQFLSLGSGPSGSRALSEDHSNLFLQSIEAIANGIVDVINKYAVKQLVDLNFNGVQKYPYLDYAGISRTDIDKLTTSYQRLVQTGGITPTEQDEAYLRKVMGLPERDPNALEKTPSDQEPAIEDENAELGLPDDKKKVENSEIERAVAKRIASIPTTAGRMEFLEKRVAAAKKLAPKSAVFAKVERVLAAELAAMKRKVFQEENNFKSWRKLTFAEKKVNFDSLQKFIDKNEAALMDDAAAILKKSSDEYMTKLTKYVNENDKQAIKDLEMPYWSEYKEAIKYYLKSSFDFGKNNASREMDVKAPSSPQDLGQTLDLMADTIATQHFYEIETQAKQALGNQLTKFGEKEIRALASAAVAIASSGEDLVRNTAAIVVSDLINKGRKLVFDKNANKIHALQRSEILDEVTCNFCLSMDGRIVEPDDSIAKEGTFHSNCRGIWVEILKDEEELPEVTGVPNSLRDRLGDEVNDLVQPKKPIVRKDSLAAKAIAKGKAGQDDNVEASELKADHPRQCRGCGSGRHQH